MNRVIYSANTVFVSESPGSDNHTGLFDVCLLDRIQSADVTISTEVKRFKQIGYDSFLFKNFYNPPEIKCSLTFYNSDTSNESLLGLDVNGYSIFSNQNTTGKDKNLFLISDSVDGRDISSVSNLSGVYVFGLGNCLIENYAVRGAVNEIPTTTINFVANNILYDTYTGNNLIPSLSISGFQTGCRYSFTSGIFDKSNYVSNQSERPTAIRPGDIKVVMSQPKLAGGIYATNTGKLQNFEINIPFDRQQLLGFGNNFTFDRKLMIPVVGTLSMSAIFDNLQTGIYSDVFNLDSSTNIDIQLYDCNNNKQINYKIDQAKLVSQGFNFSIGTELRFDGSFEFAVDPNQGFKISGRSKVFDEDAILFLDALNTQDPIVRDSINEFVNDLKSYNLWYKMSGIYPFVGGTAFSHKYNLKNPTDLDTSFRLNFQGAGTVHTSSGVEFLGSNDYADTFFYPKSDLTGLPVHISVLSLENSSQNTIDIGSFEAVNNRLLFYLDTSLNAANFDAYDSTNGRVSISNINSKAFLIGSRIAYNSGFLLAFNESSTPTKSQSNTTSILGSDRPDFSVFLGNVNNNGSPYALDGDRKIGFFSIGDGLNSGECVSLYVAVKNLQLNLGRNESVFI